MSILGFSSLYDRNIWGSHSIFETERDRRYVPAIDCFFVPSYCLVCQSYLKLYLYYYLKENYWILWEYYKCILFLSHELWVLLIKFISRTHSYVREKYIFMVLRKYLIITLKGASSFWNSQFICLRYPQIHLFLRLKS